VGEINYLEILNDFFTYYCYSCRQPIAIRENPRWSFELSDECFVVVVDGAVYKNPELKRSLLPPFFPLFPLTFPILPSVTPSTPKSFYFLPLSKSREIRHVLYREGRRSIGTFVTSENKGDQVIWR